MSSLWLIVFIVMIVCGFCQISTCDDPPSSNHYAWVIISNIKQDLDGNNFNGKWIPYSLTQCFFGVYIYQLSDASLPNIYLCHATSTGYWTITDTICNQTDAHRKAYCQLNRHDISYCSGMGVWQVQTNTTIYESGGNPPPISIQLPTHNPTTLPTKSPTLLPTYNPTKSPTNNPTLYPTQSTINPTNNPTQSPTKHLYQPNAYIPATITVYCDDFANVSVSHDNGNTFEQIGYSLQWIDVVFAIINVTKHTIVRTDCDDNLHSGGFISTINYDRHTYSTINPISNCNWNIISALSGQTDTQSFVYSIRNGWNPNQYIANDAVWIWNGVNGDNIRFEFDFGNIIRTQYPTNNPTILPTYNPTMSPTLYTNIPTITPTYNPTISPSNNPTISPIITPTKQPTKSPTYPYGVVNDMAMTTTELSNINQSFNDTQSNYSMLFTIILLCVVLLLLLCCCILCVIYIKKRNKVNNLKIDRFETSPNLMKVASTSMAEMIVNANPRITTGTPIGNINASMDINTGNIDPITPIGNIDPITPIGNIINANPSTISVANIMNDITVGSPQSIVIVGSTQNKYESDDDDDMYLYAKKTGTGGNDNDNDNNGSEEGIFDENDDDVDIEEGVDELYFKQNPDIKSTAGYTPK